MTGQGGDSVSLGLRSVFHHLILETEELSSEESLLTAMEEPHNSPVDRWIGWPGLVGLDTATTVVWYTTLFAAQEGGVYY